MRRRPRTRHLVLALCYAALVAPVLDQLYWRRRGGAFNHRPVKGA